MLIAVRLALYLDLMLIAGMPLFALYTLRGAERHTEPVLSPIVTAALSLAGAALSVFGFLLLVATMSELPVTGLDHETVAAVLDGTAIGAAAKIRIAALIGVGLLSLALRSRPVLSWTIQSFLGGVALCSLAWTGHGAADDGPAGTVHLVADLVHLLAAAVWIGALAGLLVLLFRAGRTNRDRPHRTALAHRALRGFSTIGTTAVATIVLTGLVNSWMLVGLRSIPSLGASLYGRLLVLKLALFTGMLCLAAVNRFRLTPLIGVSLKAGEGTPQLRAVTRSVFVESTLAVSVLILVAWLGTLMPPAAAV